MSIRGFVVTVVGKPGFKYGPREFIRYTTTREAAIESVLRMNVPLWRDDVYATAGPITEP